jgi:NAD(P)-dependent dehydrogenase (short-subunit alcohol dehydrogenase family)
LNIYALKPDYRLPILAVRDRDVARETYTYIVPQALAAPEISLAVYSGTKGFVLAFTKSLAREVGPYDITVNAVCPGSIVTDMNRGIYPPERQVARARELPLRRLGDPMDVAEAVLFLAADSGRFVTGQCVDVNGGATMA